MKKIWQKIKNWVIGYSVVWEKDGKIYKVVEEGVRVKVGKVWRKDYILYKSLSEEGEKGYMVCSKKDFFDNTTMIEI